MASLTSPLPTEGPARDLGGPAPAHCQRSEVIMPHLSKLTRLEELKRALETAVRMTKEPAVCQTLMGLAAQDPERWNFVLDSLSAGMEPGEWAPSSRS